MWKLVAMLPEDYAMLMRPDKAETAGHGCHFTGDIAVRMRKVPVLAFYYCFYTKFTDTRIGN